MKNKIIYKIITTATIFAPTLIYIFLAATLFNINVTHELYADGFNEVLTDDGVFIYTDETNALYAGITAFNEELSVWGMYINEGDILKVNGNYYGFDRDGNFTDIKKFELQKKEQYNIPMAALVAVGLIALIVSAKMLWKKKYPEIAVFVALLVGTIILFVLDTIIHNMLMVFLWATVSAGLYVIEKLVYYGKLTKAEAVKIESETARELRKYI